MKVFQVQCKRKHSLYERIESIGCIDTTSGEECRFTEDEAIKLIESKAARFVVRDKRGDEAPVEVEEREGRKFLATKPDGIKSDNLLAMPECEAKKIVTPPAYHPVPPARSHCVHHNRNEVA
jgi:Protein of unknown function (DUF3892)